MNEETTAKRFMVKYALPHNVSAAEVVTASDMIEINMHWRVKYNEDAWVTTKQGDAITVFRARDVLTLTVWEYGE